ncbi:FecR domain-containing protein [Porticoccus sp. W117]|uniref:FecR family protein n=1 Tax=Porticoccus sp. W117 TaxID=3054777 RepID=UPI002599856F|nr:FecR domain-containing protein [Porticoccus sp. W117]MDM3871973.1 FecR domain-containing protein [Porticoccus sp. W117]
MSERDIRDQVYYWVTEMSSGSVDADTIARFDAWYAADKRHAKAYDEVEGLFFGLADVPGLDGMAALQPTVAEHPEKPVESGLLSWLKLPAMWGAVAACLLVAVVVLLQPFTDTQPESLQYSSPVAESREIPLDDGSKVTLGASSKIQVDYSSDERRITLIRGQAFFNVAKQANRPFVVHTGNTSATAVGTRFDVRRGVTETAVAVEEGLVDTRHQNSEPLRLSAGQQVMVSTDAGMGDVQALDQVGQWREGRLAYVNVKLVEMIADANRYHPSNIILASDEIADLTLTAVFRSDQIDAMLETLTQVFPIKTVTGADGSILVMPRRDDE